MTIAFGMLCSDGVVIAADRQITSATYTYHECKINQLQWADGSALVSYAGNRDTNVKFRQELGSRFPRQGIATSEEVGARLLESLRAAVNPNEEFAALCGFWTGGSPGPSMLMGSSKADGTIQVINAGFCELIGCADSQLSRYLVGRLRGSCMYPTIYKAVLWAVRIISIVSVYDAQFVGGGVDAMTISYRPEMGRIGIGIQSNCQDMAKEIAAFDYWQDMLFEFLIDGYREPNIAQSNLDQIRQKLVHFRKWATGKDDFTL